MINDTIRFLVFLFSLVLLYQDYKRPARTDTSILYI